MRAIATIGLLLTIVAMPVTAQPGPDAPPFHSIPPINRALWGTVLPVAGGGLIFGTSSGDYRVAGLVLMAAGSIVGPYAGYVREGNGRDVRGWVGLTIRGGTGAAMWVCESRGVDAALYAGVAVLAASDLYDILWLRGKEAIPPRAPRYRVVPYFDPGSRGPGLSLRISR